MNLVNYITILLIVLPINKLKKDKFISVTSTETDLTENLKQIYKDPTHIVYLKTFQ